MGIRDKVTLQEKKLKLSKKAVLWELSNPLRKWVSEEPVEDASQQMGFDTD